VFLKSRSGRLLRVDISGVHRRFAMRKSCFPLAISEEWGEDEDWGGEDEWGEDDNWGGGDEGTEDN